MKDRSRTAGVKYFAVFLAHILYFKMLLFALAIPVTKIKFQPNIFVGKQRELSAHDYSFFRHTEPLDA